MRTMLLTLTLRRGPLTGSGIAGLMLVAGVLAGCASGTRVPPPVEDRGAMARTRPAPLSMSVAA